MSLAVLFPGQGVQTSSMGAPWREHPAWSVVERAEAALGRSLAPLLLSEDGAMVQRTQDVQLGVFVSSLLAWEASRDRFPDIVAYAGHSLGQLTALVAAGALTIEHGVRLVAARGRLTQAAADAEPGGMAALLGASLEHVKLACGAAPDCCWLANDNAPDQFVLGGTELGLVAASEQAAAHGVRRVVTLNVEGAFHTPLMAPAAEGLAAELEAIPLSSSAVPVVSNGDAWPYLDGDGWRQRLVDHLVSPVRWRQSMHTLVELGATGFVELGPGSTLAGLAKRTVPAVSVLTIGLPDQVPILQEVS